MQHSKTVNYLSALWNQPPRVSWQLLIDRLFKSNRDQKYASDVFLSAKHTRSQRLYDFLHRYQEIVRHHTDWRLPTFNSMTVIELGPGPLMGWGPLAIFCKCEAFVGVEPSHNPQLLKDPRFTDIFLRGVHRDLSAVYNIETPFDVFQSSVLNRMTYVRSIRDLNESTQADIMLSNSCLEHIEDLSTTIKALYQHAKPGSAFLHCVDFGNHLSKSDPFAEIYSSPPKTGSSIEPKLGINLLRPPDMLDIFRSAGFSVECIPYYFAPQPSSYQLHSYWTGKYSPEELFLKVGIFVGYKPVV